MLFSTLSIKQNAISVRAFNLSVKHTQYLLQQHGGATFLIPYFLMLCFGALPLFYMEVVLGQYSREGPISLWTKKCPMFKVREIIVKFSDMYYVLVLHKCNSKSSSVINAMRCPTRNCC